MTETASDVALEEIVRREAGLIAASLSRRIGDFDVAEEAVQDAIVTALRVWRRDGVPPNPPAWLSLTARRNAIDRLRRREHGERAAQALLREHTDVAMPETATDERLPLLFACCHPALAQEARLALTLRAIVGLTTAQIARAFLVPESTLAQRIVRAKRKIGQAGIPLRIAPAGEMAERLDDVLTVVSVTYNAGYLTPGVDARHDLAADAVWLAELIAGELPNEPEALGLFALLTLLEARAAARFDADGRLVPLAEQDRSRWNGDRIAAADRLLIRAAAHHWTGRFQLQAALAACHAAAPSSAETDWLQILILYDALCRLDPSPVVRLNRAIALREVNGPEAALHQVESIAGRLDQYHLLHAVRARLFTDLGRDAEAQEANRRALALAANPAEQGLLRMRIGNPFSH